MKKTFRVSRHTWVPLAMVVSVSMWPEGPLVEEDRLFINLFVGSIEARPYDAEALGYANVAALRDALLNALEEFHA